MSGTRLELDEATSLAPSAELNPLAHRLGAVTDSTPGRPGPGEPATGLAPGLALVAASAAVASAAGALLPALSPLVAAVAIGAVLTNVGLVPDSARPGLQFAAKRLLRAGVVLLGLHLAVGEVLALGGPGLLVVAAVVTATFFGTQSLGRMMGVSPSMSLLVATGFSICGASAIAAVEGVADADDEEVAFSIGLVTLCGSLAIVVLPLLAGPLGLAGDEFGMFVGASVHDVAQVVATASSHGPAAVDAAVLVKLTRVVLLAPMVAGVTLARRRSTVRARHGSGRDAATAAATPPVLPLFVVGFLVAIVVRSTGVLGDGTLELLGIVEKLLLTAALVGLGTGVHLAKLRRLGPRPLLLGLVSWILVAGTAYLGVLLVGT
ncbi:MAG: putative sulfate exporter family transporter [Microthrixaceae bacterium]|nr:putative sulfate exporter family transporter [Microthrixaceae bacterium]